MQFVFIQSLATKIFHPFEQNRPFKFEVSKQCDQEVFATLEEDNSTVIIGQNATKTSYFKMKIQNKNLCIIEYNATITNYNLV